MACCKVCCGCKECAEGEEGKCCCGNECCAAGTYCCNAECVSACSEGQEGDCKCTDACCYQGEYCCNDVCIGACAEGDNGPCKCGSSCCESGEYCCDGECQQGPCGGCECHCSIPQSVFGLDWSEGFAIGTPQRTQDGFWFVTLGLGEWNGVGADTGTQWVQEFLQNNSTCTFLLRLVQSECFYAKFYVCRGRSWEDVTFTAVAADADSPSATKDGWWLMSSCVPADAPDPTGNVRNSPYSPGACIRNDGSGECFASNDPDECRADAPPEWGQDVQFISCYTCEEWAAENPLP